MELIERALANGVTTLSITDHDSVAAYTDIGEYPSLRIIPGIELSSNWRNSGIHVLGLGIDPASTTLNEAIELQRATRNERALCIAERLENVGIRDSLSAASEVAGDAALGRVHFAVGLVKRGHAATTREAFRKYLGNGKPGDVRHMWPRMATVVEWIRCAGGLAVVAHPARYGFTATRLSRLLDDFVSAGGRGIEVTSGNQGLDVTRTLTRLCADKGMLASCGSDFHRPARPWAEIGRCTPLPSACVPIWSAWE